MSTHPLPGHDLHLWQGVSAACWADDPDLAARLFEAWLAREDISKVSCICGVGDGGGGGGSSGGGGGGDGGGGVGGGVLLIFFWYR